MKEVITPAGRLALFPDTNVDISQNNPLFTTAEEFSIDFTVPRQPNDHIFGYRYRLAGRDKTITPIEARFVFFGREKLSGTIEVTSVNEHEYSLLLKGNRSDFLFRYGDILLSELDFPWENFVPGYPSANEFMIQAEMKETLNQYRDWICFPVWHSETGQWINRWSIDSQGFVWDPGGWRTAFPRIGRTLEKMFELKGYTVTENWFTATNDRKNIVFFNNSATLGDQISLKYLLPNWSVQHMINELECYFPVTFFINSKTRKVRILGDDNLINEPVAIQLDRYLKFNPTIVFNEKERGYQLNYELPEDDETTESEWDYTDEVSATEINKYVDLPTNSTEGALYLVKSEGQYYAAKYTEVEGNQILSWEMKGSVALSIRGGLRQIERTTRIYPLLNRRTEVKETVTLTQQYVGTQRKEITFHLQTPVTNKKRLRWTEDLRVMAYRTIIDAEYEAGDVTPGYSLPLIRYPFANFVDRDNNGNALSGAAIELRWDGEKGLRGPETISFLDGAIDLEAEMVIHHADYEKIEMGKAVGILGCKAIIEELVPHYSDSEIIEVDARLKVR